jgi:hypothetical protein
MVIGKRPMRYARKLRHGMALAYTLTCIEKKETYLMPGIGIGGPEQQFRLEALMTNGK